MSTPSQFFNPLDPRLVDDPHAQYRVLREREQVHFVEPLGVWVILGHAEVTSTLKDPDAETRFEEFQRARQGEGFEAEPYYRGMRDFVLMKSGEEHRNVRGAFSRAFTPRRVEELKGPMRAKAEALIDNLVDAGATNLMDTFATPLPLSVISQLLDVPEADHDRIADGMQAFKIAIQPIPMNEEQMAIANAGIEGLTDYFTQLIAERRRTPGDDLLSALIAEADAGRLTEAELVSNSWGLYAAGHETTANAICNAVITLVSHPDQLEALRADWTLLPGAVEELLRYEGTAQTSGQRFFSKDLHVGGKVIPAGAPILNYIAAANRDPAAWGEDAEHVDIRRDCPVGHLALGAGPHKCAGQHLARATLAVAIHALFTRLDDVRIAGDVEWNAQSMLFRGPVRLDLRWRTAQDGLPDARAQPC